MSRKLKKGYYVRGLFVAEGSALDLEYKRELKGTDEPTRTDLKKESDALQKLGEDLLDMRAELMIKLELPDRLVEGVAEAKRITNFEGKRRQMQFIGKLMRKLDPAKWDQIRAALEEQHMPSVQETMVLHQAEQWRDRLIADDDAVGQWLNLSPNTDSQGNFEFPRVAVGVHEITVIPDNLPLPWSFADGDDRRVVTVRVRDDARVDIGARRQR